MQRITGIGASPGVVAGRAVILIQREQVLRYRVPSARVDAEIGRLSASCGLSREQLTEIRSSVNRRHGAPRVDVRSRSC
jgi:phosphoenolpyruvate-protein kinase (PTS system EI component)